MSSSITKRIEFEGFMAKVGRNAAMPIMNTEPTEQ